MIGFVIGLLLRLLFGGCLLYACVTDIRTCEVYNFTWWLAGAAAIGRFLLRGGVDATVLPELVFFCMVQLLCFTRLYGKADCYAFCVCAAALASEGGGLLEFVLQMALAFCMLAFVQLLRRNIDRYICFFFFEECGCAITGFLVCCICLKCCRVLWVKNRKRRKYDYHIPVYDREERGKGFGKVS